MTPQQRNAILQFCNAFHIQPDTLESAFALASEVYQTGSNRDKLEIDLTQRRTYRRAEETLWVTNRMQPPAPITRRQRQEESDRQALNDIADVVGLPPVSDALIKSLTEKDKQDAGKS